MPINLKIKEQRKVDGKLNFYLQKKDENLSWPPNSMLIYYVCEQQTFNLQKAMKSYKVIDKENFKIVTIDEIACEIYYSKRR